MTNLNNNPVTKDKILIQALDIRLIKKVQESDIVTSLQKLMNYGIKKMTIIQVSPKILAAE